MHVGNRARRQYRGAAAGGRAQARTTRRQVRGPAQGRKHHAGLLASAGADRGRVRRGRILQARRCAQIRGPGGPGKGADLRRTSCRRFQARHRHLGQRWTAAGGVHRPLRAAGARRRARRGGSRRCRSLDHSRYRRLPKIDARSCTGRARRDHARRCARAREVHAPARSAL